MNTRPYYLMPKSRWAKLIWHSKNLAGLFVCYEIARQWEATLFAIIERITQ